MAEYIGSHQGESNSVAREYPVASGVTVYDNDFVYLDATGRVSSAAIAGKRLLGTVLGGPNNAAALATARTYTPTAVGDAPGSVTVLVNIESEARFLIKCDNVTNVLSEASQGQYFNLIGNPGAQLVSGISKSATAGQLVCLKFNPGIRGTDATYGIFAVAQGQLELG